MRCDGVVARHRDGGYIHDLGLVAINQKLKGFALPRVLIRTDGIALANKIYIHV